MNAPILNKHKTTSQNHKKNELGKHYCTFNSLLSCLSKMNSKYIINILSLTDDALYYVLCKLTTEETYMILNTCSKLRGLCLARIGQLPYIGSCVGTTPSYLNWALENGLCLHKDHDRGFIQWLGEISPEYIKSARNLAFNTNILLTKKDAYRLWCFACRKNPHLVVEYYEIFMLPLGGFDRGSNSCEISDAVSSAFDITLLQKLYKIVAPVEHSNPPYSMYVPDTHISNAIISGNYQFPFDVQQSPFICNFYSMDICIEIFNSHFDMNIYNELRRMSEDKVVLAAAAFAGRVEVFNIYISDGRENEITTEIIDYLFQTDHLEIIKMLYKIGIPFGNIEALMKTACEYGVTASATWLAVTFKEKYYRSIYVILNENNHEEVAEIIRSPQFDGWSLLFELGRVDMLEEYFHLLPEFYGGQYEIIATGSMELLEFVHNKGLRFGEYSLSYVIFTENIEKIKYLLSIGYKLEKSGMASLMQRHKVLKWFLREGLLRKEEFISFMNQNNFNEIKVARVLYELK
jgi:hypothetical protein